MTQKSESLFDLKWNNFAAHLTELSTTLLQDTSLLDISIQCGTEVVKAHKLVLSACSPWFREMLTNMQPNPSPLVVLWETNMADMKSILSFMYNGEVQVEHDDLLSFLKLAGHLQVKGLTQENDEGDNKKVDEKEKAITKLPEAEDENFKKKPSTDGFLQSADNKRKVGDESSSSMSSSRPRSRPSDKKVFRKEPSATKLTKEDFDVFEKKQSAEEKPLYAADKPLLGKTDFEIKSDYERAKIREERLKEIMKNAGKDIKGGDMLAKKKQNVKKESLREQLKAFQSRTNPEKFKQPVHNESEESLLEAMLERRNNLEKISNAPLSKFEQAAEESDYPPEFDPSLLVKTEMDDTMEEEVLDTSAPNPSFSHLAAHSFKGNPSINSLMCTICGKGPYAKGKLSTHMKNVHSGVEYECTTCVKTFKCERYLQNHKRQYCPDRFKQ